jgi:hypothetical protein
MLFNKNYIGGGTGLIYQTARIKNKIHNITGIIQNLPCFIKKSGNDRTADINIISTIVAINLFRLMFFSAMRE